MKTVLLYTLSIIALLTCFRFNQLPVHNTYNKTQSCYNHYNTNIDDHHYINNIYLLHQNTYIQINQNNIYLSNDKTNSTNAETKPHNCTIDKIENDDTKMSITQMCRFCVHYTKTCNNMEQCYDVCDGYIIRQCGI